MVISMKNEIKLLMDFSEINDEKLFIKNFEALNFSEKNHYYVSQIGKILFFLITSNFFISFFKFPINIENKFGEVNDKILEECDQYSEDLKEKIRKMLFQKISIKDL